MANKKITKSIGMILIALALLFIINLNSVNAEPAQLCTLQDPCPANETEFPVGEPFIAKDMQCGETRWYYFDLPRDHECEVNTAYTIQDVECLSNNASHCTTPDYFRLMYDASEFDISCMGDFESTIGNTETEDCLGSVIQTPFNVQFHRVLMSITRPAGVTCNENITADVAVLYEKNCETDREGYVLVNATCEEWDTTGGDFAYRVTKGAYEYNASYDFVNSSSINLNAIERDGIIDVNDYNELVRRNQSYNGSFWTPKIDFNAAFGVYERLLDYTLGFLSYMGKIVKEGLPQHWFTVVAKDGRCDASEIGFVNEDCDYCNHDGFCSVQEDNATGCDDCEGRAPVKPYFDPYGDNFDEVQDIFAAENVTVWWPNTPNESNANTSITFIGPINFTKKDEQGKFVRLNVSKDLILTNHSVELTTIDIPQLNSPAQIRFANTTLCHPQITKDGYDCNEPDCVIIPVGDVPLNINNITEAEVIIDTTGMSFTLEIWKGDVKFGSLTQSSYTLANEEINGTEPIAIKLKTTTGAGNKLGKIVAFNVTTEVGNKTIYLPSQMALDEVVYVADNGRTYAEKELLTIKKDNVLPFSIELNLTSGNYNGTPGLGVLSLYNSDGQELGSFLAEQWTPTTQNITNKVLHHMLIEYYRDQVFPVNITVDTKVIEIIPTKVLQSGQVSSFQPYVAEDNSLYEEADLVHKIKETNKQKGKDLNFNVSGFTPDGTTKYSARDTVPYYAGFNGITNNFCDEVEDITNVRIFLQKKGEARVTSQNLHNVADKNLTDLIKINKDMNVTIVQINTSVWDSAIWPRITFENISMIRPQITRILQTTSGTTELEILSPHYYKVNNTSAEVYHLEPNMLTPALVENVIYELYDADVLTEALVINNIIIHNGTQEIRINISDFFTDDNVNDTELNYTADYDNTIMKVTFEIVGNVVQAVIRPLQRFFQATQWIIFKAREIGELFVGPINESNNVTIFSVNDRPPVWDEVIEDMIIPEDGNESLNLGWIFHDPDEDEGQKLTYTVNYIGYNASQENLTFLEKDPEPLEIWWNVSDATYDQTINSGHKIYFKVLGQTHELGSYTGSYTPNSQGTGALKLHFVNTTGPNANLIFSKGIIKITYDNVKTLDVYIPNIEKETILILYVANDGSTYYDESLTQLARNAPLIGSDEVWIIPDADWNGERTLTITANDSVYQKTSNAFLITVEPVNDKPVWTDDEFGSLTSIIFQEGGNDTLDLYNFAYLDDVDLRKGELYDEEVNLSWTSLSEEGKVNITFTKDIYGLRIENNISNATYSGTFTTGQLILLSKSKSNTTFPSLPVANMSNELYGILPNPATYSPGPQTITGTLKLIFWNATGNGLNFSTGTINIIYDNGKNLKIYLPEIINSTTDRFTLYVSSDGSTYYDEKLLQPARLSPVTTIVKTNNSVIINNKIDLENLQMVVFTNDQYWSGAEDIRLIATDKAGANGTIDITVYVNELGSGILLVNPDNQTTNRTINEDGLDQFNLNEYFIDGDGDAVYNYNILNISPNEPLFDVASIDVHPISGEVSIVPVRDWNGNITINFTANDGSNNNWTEVVLIVEPLMDKIKFVTTTINLVEDTPKTINATDLISDPDIYTVGEQPVIINITYPEYSHVKINITNPVNNTSEILFTLEENFNGTEIIPVTLTVTVNPIVNNSEVKTITENITFIINPVNDDMVNDTVLPTPTPTEDENFTIAIGDFIYDVDDIVNYTLTVSRGIIAVSNPLASGPFNYLIETIFVEPIMHFFGWAWINVFAENENETAEQNVSFYIDPENDTPYMLQDIPDLVIGTGQEVDLILNKYFRDVDEEVLDYTITSTWANITETNGFRTESSLSGDINAIVEYNDTKLLAGDAVALFNKTHWITNATNQSMFYQKLMNISLGSIVNDMIIFNGKIWAVGDGGIVQTFNGTWHTLTSFTTTNLNSITEFNNTIWIGGDDSTSGGELWQLDGTSFIGRTNPFVSSNVTKIVGFDGKLYVGQEKDGGDERLDYYDGTWHNIVNEPLNGSITDMIVYTSVEWGVIDDSQANTSETLLYVADDEGKIATYDGQEWIEVEANITGNVTHMQVFDGKLYLFEDNGNVTYHTNNEFAYQTKWYTITETNIIEDMKTSIITKDSRYGHGYDVLIIAGETGELHTFTGGKTLTFKLKDCVIVDNEIVYVNATDGTNTTNSNNFTLLLTKKSYLSNVTINGTSINYSFSGTETINGTTIKDSCIYDGNLTNATLIDSIKYNVTMINSDNTNSTVNNTNEENSTIIDSVVVDSNVTNSTINNCTVINSTIIDSTCQDGYVVNSYIDPSILIDVTLWNVNVTDSNLTGSMFRNAIIKNSEDVGSRNVYGLRVEDRINDAEIPNIATLDDLIINLISSETDERYGRILVGDIGGNIPWPYDEDNDNITTNKLKIIFQYNTIPGAGFDMSIPTMTMDLIYDGAKQIEIYTPAIELSPENNVLILYVSADGSTYYDEELKQLARAAPSMSVIENSKTENSIITNSTIEDSTIKDSTVVDSYVDPSTVIDSILNNAIVLDSDVVNSNVTDSNITNGSVVDNSVVDNSWIFDSDLDNVVYYDVTAMYITDKDSTRTGAGQVELDPSTLEGNTYIGNVTVTNSNISNSVLNNSEINNSEFCDFNVTDAMIVNNNITIGKAVYLKNGSIYNTSVPVIPNTCEEEEEEEEPTTGGGGGGGGGGSSGGFRCVPNWQCTTFGPCTIGKQTRICTDAKACGTMFRKPLETKLCITGSAVGATCFDNVQNQGETGIDCGGPCSSCARPPQRPPVEEEEPTPPPIEEEPRPLLPWLLILLAVILLGIFAAALTRRHHTETIETIPKVPTITPPPVATIKKEEDELKKLEHAIGAVLNKGFTREDIKMALIKRGWQEATIEKALKEIIIKKYNLHEPHGKLQKLEKSIESVLDHQYTCKDIRGNLVKKGWPRDVVDEAMHEVLVKKHKLHKPHTDIKGAVTAIKEVRCHGFTKEVISKKLLQKGWPKKRVNEIMKQVK